MDSILLALLFAPLVLIFGLADKAERYASITSTERWNKLWEGVSGIIGPKPSPYALQ